MSNTTTATVEPKFHRGDRITFDSASGTEFAVVTSVEITRSYYDKTGSIRRYNVRFDDGTKVNIGVDRRVSLVESAA